TRINPSFSDSSNARARVAYSRYQESVDISDRSLGVSAPRGCWWRTRMRRLFVFGSLAFGLGGTLAVACSPGGDKTPDDLNGSGDANTVGGDGFNLGDGSIGGGSDGFNLGEGG